MEENMQSRRCRGGAQNTPVTSTYPDNVWIPRPPRHRISTEFVAHDFSNYRHHNFIRTHTRIFRSWHAVTSVLCMFEFSEFFRYVIKMVNSSFKSVVLVRSDAKYCLVRRIASIPSNVSGSSKTTRHYTCRSSDMLHFYSGRNVV